LEVAPKELPAFPVFVGFLDGGDGLAGLFFQAEVCVFPRLFGVVFKMVEDGEVPVEFRSESSQ